MGLQRCRRLLAGYSVFKKNGDVLVLACVSSWLCLFDCV